MLQTNILFVDGTNNGRSILAEAYLNCNLKLGVRAFSAGLVADEALDRHIYEILREERIAPDDYCPKPIDIFLQSYSPRIDLLVGFTPECDGFKLPIFPNHPPFVQLKVEPVRNRCEQMGRKRAVRTCFADVKLVIDRAMASGKLPGPLAA